MQRVIIVITALLCACGGWTTLSAASIGFRNDGSGHWPDAQAPTRWDDQGAGTAWKITLPHWGNGEPIVVDDRLYLIQDLDWWNFERVAPSLLCLDAKDGSVIWEAELDHTLALPSGQAKQARADWVALRRKYQEGWSICESIAREHGPGPKGEAAARERLTKVGLDLGKPLTVFNLRVTDPKYREIETRLKASHFWTLAWSQPRGQWCGAGYATPVSDGERIWVTTGYGAAFCIDLSGRVLWTTLLEGASGEKQGWCVSPVLVDGVLVIADTENCHGWDALGLDTATGKERWRIAPWPSWEGYAIGSSLVLHPGGKPVVHLPSGRVIRPSDGKILAKGLGRQKWTASTGAGDLLVVPFMGGRDKKSGKTDKNYDWVPDEDSLVAWRLAWSGGDSLQAERLWAQPITGRNLEISPVLANGLIFQVTDKPNGICAFDASTGKQVGHRDGAALGRPRYSWNLAVAGDHLYTVDYLSGAIAVLRADRELAVVANNPPIGRTQEECPIPYATWRIGAGRTPDPRLPQTGALAFGGGRLYVRAWQHLYAFER